MTDDERAALVEALRDPVAASLADLHACSRAWEAWQYGTMTVDDFFPAAEDEDIIANVVEAVLPVFLAKIEADGKRLALAEKTIAALRHAGGRPIDQAWVKWRQAIIDYDAAKEAQP